MPWDVIFKKSRDKEDLFQGALQHDFEEKPAAVKAACIATSATSEAMAWLDGPYTELWFGVARFEGALMDTESVEWVHTTTDVTKLNP